MGFVNKYSQEIIENFFSFKVSIQFKELLQLYNDEDINVHALFSALTYYVLDELIEKNKLITIQEENIYKYVEQLRLNFSEYSEGTDELDVDSAICTCFLENLLNRASHEVGGIEYSRFIPYLGKKSKDYCRAWDQFTGVRSEGLWTDDQWINAKKGRDSLK